MGSSMFDGPEFANIPDANDGAALLDDLLSTITRYVVFPDENAAKATALWIVTTHALPAFQHAPRLVISSPQKRCGKSRTLDVISGTCHRPLVSVNATVAAIFRSIGDEHPPTLIIDEADTLFGTKRAAEQNEDLRALLNAGHQRGRPALRCVGPNQIPTEFSTFAMAALAGIGSMPDTITDRAINYTMRRRTSGERVAQFRSRRDGPILDELRIRLADWASANVDRLGAAEPEMPVEDRAADTWEPLIAVADAAGGHWPQTARTVCVAMVNEASDDDEEQSLATRLLADVRDVFADKHTAFLSSMELVAELRRVEESPWDDFDLNPRKLARRLSQFGIKPGHNTTKTARGYALEAFADSLERYTRPNPSKPSETPDMQEQSRDAKKPPDGSIRPAEKTRPTEIPAQRTFGTSRTDSDAPPEQSARGGADLPGTPGGLSVASPGQTDLVETALANASASRNRRAERCVPLRVMHRLPSIQTVSRAAAVRPMPRHAPTPQRRRCGLKRAIIHGRRTLADGRRLLQVVCPVCDGRHWIPADATTSQCPRRGGVFTLTTERTTHA